MARQVGDASDKALPYVENADPDYFTRFIQTIDAPYMIPYNAKKLTDIAISNSMIGKSVQYDEEKGDACYARLLGTYKEGDR